MTILTVSQLNKYISFKLKDDSKLRGIFVRGEISNLRSSGHIYFTIKDETSLIRAVMFASNARLLKFTPENGMNVLVMGSVTVYERDGAYQLYVTDMQPAGQGMQQAELEKLKNDLASQGIFDQAHKLSLPVFPRRIGVVTSAYGAAVKDIINVIGRRFPLTELYIFHTLVQGIHAAQNICESLHKAVDSKCDVIILGRGGGSSEDLSAFNDKNLAYCIYELTVPVISAVGHETDFTIADFAADMRAPTPSAAAELAVVSASDVIGAVDDMKTRLSKACSALLSRRYSELSGMSARLSAVSPEVRLEKNRSAVEMISGRLGESLQRMISLKQSSLTDLTARLETLNPMNVLDRGYAVVHNSHDEVISSVSKLHNSEEITITLSDGSVKACIINGTVK